MAAVNIGGVTLHSWAGVGRGDKERHVYAAMFKTKPFYKVAERWCDTDTLILDESVYLPSIEVYITNLLFSFDDRWDIV